MGKKATPTHTTPSYGNGTCDHPVNTQNLDCVKVAAQKTLGQEQEGAQGEEGRMRHPWTHRWWLCPASCLSPFSLQVQKDSYYGQDSYYASTSDTDGYQLSFPCLSSSSSRVPLNNIWQNLDDYKPNAWNSDSCSNSTAQLVKNKTKQTNPQKTITRNKISQESLIKIGQSCRIIWHEGMEGEKLIINWQVFEPVNPGNILFCMKERDGNSDKNLGCVWYYIIN